MIKEIDLQGVWFLPDNKDLQISGNLTFDTKSCANLQLFGVFDDEVEFQNVDFILGLTTENKKITLYKCYQDGWSMSNGFRSSKYDALYIIVGEHFHSLEEFQFSVMNARFKNLDKWVRKFGFAINNDFDKKEYGVYYTKPDNIVFKISDTLMGKFVFNYSYPLSGHTDQVTLTQTVFFELQSSTSQPFRDLLSNLLLFQNFLTLLTFEAAYPTAMNIELDDRELTVVYKPGFDYVPARRGYEHFLFYYTDFSDSFEAVISKWYQLKSSIDPVTDLLLGSFYGRKSNIINRFLDMAHALETYHRRFKDVPPFPKEEYKAWAKNLVELVTDEKYKEMLKGKLNFSNEQSLNARIVELIENLNIDTINKIVGDKATFIKNFKNSRNYYTHYSAALKSKALADSDLISFTDRLKVILLATVLLETGFTLDKISEILTRSENWFFNHLLENES